MPIIEEKVVKMENDVSSPTNNSFVEPFFSIGSEVEVSTEEKGYSGAWYEATIIAPPKSTTPASNNSDSSNKSKRKIWGYWVEYKHLLDDKDGSTRLREYIRKRSILRPAPPTWMEDERLCFRVTDIVDAFHLAGWWTGVVVRVVGTGTGSIGCKFRVAFKDPDEELEFSQNDLRLHVDWVGGKWVAPVSTDEKVINYLRSIWKRFCTKEQRFIFFNTVFIQGSLDIYKFSTTYGILRNKMAFVLCTP